MSVKIKTYIWYSDWYVFLAVSNITAEIIH